MPEHATQAAKGAAFAALHAGEPFLIPNPWDAGSARVLEALGFPALATTSSGFAFTLGRLDGGATLDELPTTWRPRRRDALPVSADLENGYGHAPEDAAGAITRVAEAGAVGGSIEDWDPSRRLYDSITPSSGSPPRSRRRGLSASLRAHRPRREPPPRQPRPRRHDRAPAGVRASRRRLLYAPGLRTVEEIRAVCEATAKPVNVLARPGLTMAEIFAAGAQRVSVGGRSHGSRSTRSRRPPSRSATRGASS